MDEQQKREFIAWLDRQITSSEAMLGQFDKQTFLPASVKEALVIKEKTELEACKVVRKMLANSESFSVHGDRSTRVD